MSGDLGMSSNLGDRVRFAIFCDFDETITRTNVTDGVLEKFADPLWLQIQEDWLAGRLSARKVLEDQMPLVEVSRGALNDFIDSVEIDPFFTDFVSSCTQNNDSLYILSDGFDYWIDRILRRVLSPYNGAVKDISFYSCNLRLREKKFDISFPYFPQGCIHGCATCKPELFQRLKSSAEKSIVIGDGRSDQILASAADLVVAKDGLRDFCESENIPSHSFRDFSDVIRIINTYWEKA